MKTVFKHLHLITEGGGDATQEQTSASEEVVTEQANGPATAEETAAAE